MKTNEDRKLKKQIELVKTLYQYSIIDVSDKFEDLKQMKANRVEMTDNRGWEKLFHELPQDQLEVFICLYMGFKPREIVNVLGFKNIARFYNVNAKLKRIYREQNWRIFEYN